MKGGTLFSGIGAPECAMPEIDWRWCAEIDPFASAVHAARFPAIPNLGDVTAVDWSAVEPVDLIVAGPPCQDHSVAGRRAGMAGERGLLSLRFVDFLDAVDPEFCLVENVPGWLSLWDNAFGQFLGRLVGASAALVPARGQRWTDAGVADGPRRTAAWRVLDAQFFGVPQRRRRVFVLAVRGAGNFSCAEALFPLQQSVPRNFAPRRAKGEGVAASPESGAGLSIAAPLGAGDGARGWRNDLDQGAFIPVADPISTSENRTYTHEGRNNFRTHNLIAHTLRADGFDGGEDGTGRGVPLTLAVRGRGDSHDLEYRDDGVANAILAPGGGRGGAGCGAVAYTVSQNSNGFSWESDVSPAIQAFGGGDTNTQSGIRSGMSVRRLTPREAERLQGFPDDFTLIPYRGKPAANAEYRSLGNSMAVPVLRWLLGQIEGFR